MLRGIQIRLYPNEEQSRYARRLLGDCRFIYNKLTAFVRDADKGKTSSAKDRYAYYMSLQKDFPFLTETHSKVRAQSRVDFDAALQNHFTRHTGLPKFKKKDRGDSCRFPVDAIMGVHGNRIDLVKAFRDIHFKCSKRDMRFLNRNREAVRSATLRLAPSGKFMMSVLVEDGHDYALQKQGNPKYAGVDLGLKDFCVIADGETVRKVEAPRIGRKAQERIARLQRALARKQKGGENRRKTKARLARAFEKTKDFRTEFLHRESTRLVTENQGIAVETLNVKGLMKNHKLARSVGDASWSRFVQMLEYKCLKFGRELRKADRWFASSQTCHVCGKASSVTKDLSVRDWVCPHCGAVLDRDGNAALNLRRECFGLELGLGSPEETPVETEALALSATDVALKVKLPSKKQETKTGLFAVSC